MHAKKFVTSNIACVASVSVRFGSKELQRIRSYFLLSPHFSRGQNAENPVLRSLLHGNDCYAGYVKQGIDPYSLLIILSGFIWPFASLIYPDAIF